MAKCLLTDEGEVEHGFLHAGRSHGPPGLNSAAEAALRMVGVWVAGWAVAHGILAQTDCSYCVT